MICQNSRQNYYALYFTSSCVRYAFFGRNNYNILYSVILNFVNCHRLQEQQTRPTLETMDTRMSDHRSSTEMSEVPKLQKCPTTTISDINLIFHRTNRHATGQFT